MATRVLFALNSDDPDIVSQGLEEFHRQIVKDHDIELSYGYHGRGCSDVTLEIFRPRPVTSIVGGLAAFIRASPQLEELFVLWGLPGRDDDKRLCTAHMACFAVMLHCATVSQSVLCSMIVNRILHEFPRSLVSQLTSGDMKLVHSTLGLILAMCRSSTQNCRDTVQKLLNTSPNTYALLLQAGKTITWEASIPTNTTMQHSFEEDAEPTSAALTKIKTDARLLLILIVLTALESSDYTMAGELFASGTSLLKRVTNAIHKDVPGTVQLVLECLMHFRRQVHMEQLLGSRLVDTKFQNNLLMMYNHTDERIRELSHSFLVNHCTHLATTLVKATANSSHFNGSRKSSAAAGYARYVKHFSQSNLSNLPISLQSHT